MSARFRITALFQLTATPVIPRIEDHGGVLVKGGPVENYPKGTLLAQGEDGDWYAYRAHFRSPKEAIEMMTGDYLDHNWPSELFRDYWIWVCSKSQNKGAPLYDALFAAPRKRLQLRKV